MPVVRGCSTDDVDVVVSRLPLYCADECITRQRMSVVHQLIVTSFFSGLALVICMFECATCTSHGPRMGTPPWYYPLLHFLLFFWLLVGVWQLHNEL